MLKDFQQLTIKIVNFINSPQKTQRIIRDTTVPRMVLNDFVEAIRSFDNKGFFLGSCSEISLRIKGGKLLITAPDRPMSRVTEETLLAATINPDITGSNSNFPRHIDWHRSIYMKNEANAIMLCQPVFSCIVSGKMQIPDKTILVEGAEIIDSIKYAEISDMQFDNEINLGNEGIFLIRSIGELAWGKNLDEVFSRVELVERICEIQIKSI